jgi:hypothetical protein
VTPGQKLRELRSSLRLSLRDVEAASCRIALEHQQTDFTIPFSRLFEIESKGMVPTIYRLYSMSAIYRSNYDDLLLMYRIDVDRLWTDLSYASVPVTHKIKTKTVASPVRPLIHGSTSSRIAVPSATTSNQPWSQPPNLYGDNKAAEKLVIIHVGTQDYTMFPLIAPSSLLQVDESVRRIRNGGWRSEHERPIYLVETRQDGLRIGWCSLSNSELMVQAHPLSPTPAKSYRHPHEAEVVGQVVAVSTRLLCASEFGAGRNQESA